MNSFAPILLRCILAIALVTGGLPAWGVSTMTTLADTAGSQDTRDGDKADCQETMAEHQQHGGASDDPAQDCCEKETSCQHDACRCLCPATNLVVPIRVAPVSSLARSHPPAVLNAPAPNNVITTLLRPPRA